MLRKFIQIYLKSCGAIYGRERYLGSLSKTLRAVKHEPLFLTPTHSNISATVFTEQSKISASLGKPKFLVLGFLALVPFAVCIFQFMEVWRFLVRPEIKEFYSLTLGMRYINLDNSCRMLIWNSYLKLDMQFRTWYYPTD